MRNYNYIGVSLCLYLIVAQLSVVCFEFASLVVNADSKIINAVTTYQFDFNRMQDSNFQTTPYNTVLIQPSDKLIINFPSTYTLTTVTCIISIDYGSQFSPSCTVSADKVIVSNIVSTATGIGFVSVWVSNIQNPSPAITTDYFTGSIGSDTSASGYFASSIVLQPGTFASCYSTFSPSTVNSTGDLILTLTPSNSIGSTGYIVISFPITRRWVNDISSTNFMPISSSMSCSSRSAVPFPIFRTCSPRSNAPAITWQPRSPPSICSMLQYPQHSRTPLIVSYHRPLTSNPMCWSPPPTQPQAIASILVISM